MPGVGPDVEQVGVAHAVRQEARHADELAIKPAQRDVLGLLEGAAKRGRAASVVEVVGRQALLGQRPVHSIEAIVDVHRRRGYGSARNVARMWGPLRAWGPTAHVT